MYGTALGRFVGRFIGALASLALFCGAARGALVGHWMLDETGTPATVADASGNSLTGTVNGGAAPVADGMVDGGMSFDGVDGYVEVPPDDLLNQTTAVSIALWIRPASLAGEDSVVLTKRSDGALPPYSIEVNTNGAMIFSYGGIDNSTWYSVVSDNGMIPVGTWTHVACTRDQACTRLRMFINGTQHKEGTCAQEARANGAQGLYMARSNQIQFQYFEGDLDDVRLYDAELTQQEIDDIFNTESTPAISILATDGQAAEDGDSGASADTAVFTLSVDPAPSEAVTVNVTIEDSVATGGGDYTVTGATPVTGTDFTVAVGSGETEAVVTIVPANDSDVELLQTVTVTVEAGTGYAVADSPDDQAECTVADDDVAPGTFALVSPSTGSLVNPEEDVEFTWQASTGAASYRLVIAEDDGFATIVLDQDAGGATSYTVTSVSGTLGFGETYYWKAVAVNASGSTDSASAFTLDTAAEFPEVAGTVPSDGSGKAKTDIAIRIVFTEEMAAASIAGAVTVSGGVTGSGELQPDGRTVVFTLDSELDYDTTYTVTIAATVTDAYDKAMQAPYEFSFTTFQELAGLGAGEGCAVASRAGRPQGAPAAILLLGALAWVALARRAAGRAGA